MTTAVVILLGAGVLLIISAMENSSLVATFQAIWTGQPISSLSSNTSSTTTATTKNQSSTVPLGTPFTLPPSGKPAPPGINPL